MKRILLVILSLVLLLGAIPAVYAADGGTEETVIFTDIAKSWAKSDILWAYENGVANGVTADTFAPGASLTRGMFVCFLARTAKLAGVDVTPSSAESPFDDVKTSQWYYSAAAWAYENNVVSGTGKAGDKAVFSPNNPITRQESATMFQRFLKFLGAKIGTDGAKEFPDGSSIAAWAKNATVELTAIGIFKGDDKGNFNPQGKADRATAVSLCHRIYDLICPTEENAPDIPYVSYSPLNYNTADVSDLSFTVGKVRFTATLKAADKVILSAPGAQEEDLKTVSSEGVFAVDGKEHTYDIVWLDNNAVVFYCDGERITVAARERTYAEQLDEEQYLTTLQYQNPTCDAPAVSVSFEGFTPENPVLYRAVDRSPFALHGELSVVGTDIHDENGDEMVLTGAAVTLMGTSCEENAYPDNDNTQPMYFTTYEELKWIRDDMRVNTIRITVIPGDITGCVWGYSYCRYVDAVGEDRERWDANISSIIENCKKLGLYAILDWHGYEETAHGDDPRDLTGNGDVRIYDDEAEEFFSLYAEKYADYGNLLFDLYNEASRLSGRWGDTSDGQLTNAPKADVVEYFRDNEGFLEWANRKKYSLETEDELNLAVALYAWSTHSYRVARADGKGMVSITMMPGYEYCFSAVLKPYSERMIAAIRKYIPNAICFIPTPNANQNPECAAIDPLDCGNVLYVIHTSGPSKLSSIIETNTLKLETAGLGVIITETGFYPQSDMREDGLEVTYENAKLYGEEYITWYKRFTADAGRSCITWRFLRAYQEDSFYENMFSKNTIPSDVRSGFTGDELTYHGQIMRTFWRGLAGLTD